MTSFNPKATLAALITGAASIGGLCACTIAALAPLETVPGLEALRPYLGHVSVVLGATSALSLAVASIGRSVTLLVNGQPVDSIPLHPSDQKVGP
jgi:hypothetical protein